MEGYEEYLKKDDGSILPPIGDFIVLAESRSDESGSELNINGVPRGIFTNALLDVLSRTNLKYLTYAELISRVHTRVQNRTNAQTPQHPIARAYGRQSLNNFFFQDVQSENLRFYVKYDKKEGWIVDLGEIHGMRRGARLTIVEVNGQEMMLQTRSVLPGYSLVEPEGWLDTAIGEYLIKEIDLRFSPLALSIPSVDTAEQKTMERAIMGSKKLVLDWEHAQYWATVDPERGYVLTRAGEEMPVFKSVRLNSPDPLNHFIKKLEIVAHWEHVLELTNPLANVNIDTWLDIELLEVVEHQNYFDLTKAEHKSIGEEAVFTYQYRDGQWMEPALQLRIRNKSSRTLWVTGLFLSEDFSITDLFMPVRKIQPGSEPYYFTDETGNDVVVFWLPDEIYSWGYTESVNHIKIIASSESFDVTNLCNGGLELEFQEIRTAHRGARPAWNTPQWVTKDIQLRIVRPLEDRSPAAAENER